MALSVQEGHSQGDQMRLCKNRPKRSPTINFVTINVELQPWKHVAKILELCTSAIFKKTTQSKQSPRCENSPNLVTLNTVTKLRSPTKMDLP
jgi:hypothetical protein